MNSILDTYPLGFYDNNGIETIYAKQNDTERWVKFKLEDKGLGDYIVDNDLNIVFKERYSDGTIMMPFILPLTCVVDNNTALTFQLTSKMLAIAGIAKCEISIIESNGTLIFDDKGTIENSDYKQLTTTNFNIYIDQSVISTNDNIQPLNEEDLFNLQSIIITIQKGELNRNRNEGERIAREGRGNYASHENLSYLDENNEVQTIDYKDSRVGLYERLKAMNDGGTFINEDGEVKTFTNTYINQFGEEIEADISDLDNLSYKAIGAYLKSLADDNYWTTLSESYTHGGTGLKNRPNEDIDNALYYFNRSSELAADSQDSLEQCQEVYSAIQNYIDANIPNVEIDFETGHLLWEGGIFNFYVDPSDGHLKWEMVNNPDYGSGGSSSIDDATVNEIMQRLNQLEDIVQW